MFRELWPDKWINEVWGRLLGTRLVGVADMHRAHGELYVAADGRCFGRSCIHDAFYFEGASFADAAERSMLGRRSQPLLRRISHRSRCMASVSLRTARRCIGTGSCDLRARRTTCRRKPATRLTVPLTPAPVPANMEREDRPMTPELFTPHNVAAAKAWTGSVPAGQRAGASPGSGSC